MEYIHTALLLHSAGKDVNENNVSDVLEAAGLEADSARVKSLVAALDGVDIDEAMNQAVATGAAPAQPSGGQQEEAAEEEADDEADDEDDDASEEEAAEGLGELF